MKLEDWQALWREQAVPPVPSEAALVRAVARIKTDSRAFERVVFWRDLRESVAALAVALVFGWTAWSATVRGQPSAWLWVAASLPVAVAGFLLIDRAWAARLQPRVSDTLVGEIDRALAKLRHQAWLLRQVQWWYGLPLTLSGAIIALTGVTRMPASPAVRLGVGAVMVGVIVAVNLWIWRMNQQAVRNQIQPKIDLLEQQRRSLGSE